MMRKKRSKVRDWEYTPEGIDYSLDSARDFLSVKGRYWVSKVLAFLPENIIDFVVDNIVFIGEQGDGSYFSFNHIFFKNKRGFILFSNNSLWNKNKMEIAFTIVHEIAHAWRGDSELKHFEDLEIKDEGPPRREIEADKLAIQWLDKHYKKEELMKLCNYFRKKKEVNHEDP